MIPGHADPPEVAIVPEGPEIIAEGAVGPVIATLPADGPATTMGSTREGKIAIGFGSFHSDTSGGHQITGSGLLFTITGAGLTIGARYMIGGATGAV